MRKISFSEALPRLMIGATVITLLVVFLTNVFPPLKEAELTDNSESSSISTNEGSVGSRSEIEGNSGNFPSNDKDFRESEGNSPSFSQNVPSNSQNFPSNSQTFPSNSQNFPSYSQNSSSQSQNIPSYSQNIPPQSQSGKININTASLSELMTLDGIGEVKANAIIEYRTANGDFKSIDDLVLVKGIGEKTLEKNRDRITV